MRKIAKKYGIEFMNLGYLDELNVNGDAHSCLYEKTLAVCPLYPDKLKNTAVLDVGCGIGGGIRWIKRWALT
jgi:2-polyprenyl-3-methyl-5-hydroxy-6-metoxy-1,4-benzoquinol methylase